MLVYTIYRVVVCGKVVESVTSEQEAMYLAYVNDGSIVVDNVEIQ